MRSRYIAVILAVLSSTPLFAAADDMAPPVTSDKPFKRLFSGTDPRQRPTQIKGQWQPAVADCGALKRADPQHDARMRAPAPAQPQSRSRDVVPFRCKP